MDIDAYPSSTLLTAIETVGILMRRTVRDSCRIGTSDFRMLAVLVRKPEGTNPKAICDVLGISALSVSESMSRLLRLNFVDVVRDRRD